MSVSYLLRFSRHTKTFFEFGNIYYSNYGRILYFEVCNFICFFDKLFLTQDLSYWENWENKLEETGHLHQILCLYDMFIYEYLRIYLGVECYAQFWRILSILNPIAIFPLLHCKNFVPNEQNFCDFYHNTPLDAFEGLFYPLVKQLVEKR
ncbi:hypothetical protein [Candidatus Harpocratesius sp.]